MLAVAVPPNATPGRSGRPHPPGCEHSLPLVTVGHWLTRGVAPAILLPPDVPVFLDAVDCVRAVPDYLDGNVPREGEERLGHGPNLHQLMRHPERRALRTPDLDVVLDDHVRPPAAAVRR